MFFIDRLFGIYILFIQSAAKLQKKCLCYKCIDKIGSLKDKIGSRKTTLAFRSTEMVNRTRLLCIRLANNLSYDVATYTIVLDDDHAVLDGLDGLGSHAGHLNSIL